MALYRAKTEAGPALRFYEAEMGRQVRERASLEQELRAAIDNDAIQPFYQPLIDLKSGRVRGFEALARWTGEHLETIGPERFIPIVEDIGLIGRLTDALLERACTDALRWPPDMRIAFNLSPLLLRDASFTSRILSIITRTGLLPSRLQLEITESAIVRDVGLMEKALGGLRDVGVRIALDNFGTGYSTLYHLRNFKVDCLKIDRHFVESMARDGESEAIVRALVGLGEGLGMEVDAEGVETVDQQRLLIDHGCRAAQGFLFSKAVPSEETLAFVTSITRGADIGRTG
jgi:EAL domain-containing protein (putative c-di-GMP-specific phosphodiesterase class I)